MPQAQEKRVDLGEEATMGIEEILGGKGVTILRLADKHGAYIVLAFGSVAREEVGPTSDMESNRVIVNNVPLFIPEMA